MFSRSLSILAAVVLVASAIVVSAPEAAAQRGNSRLKIRQVSPQRGATVKVGETVTIEWEFIGGNGQPVDEDTLRWCEQEIFLSLDGGRTLDRRITIHLDPRDRTSEWVVPNTPTDTAVLDIHYGCEADGLPHETPNVQKAFMFKIVPGDIKPPQVHMKAMPKEIIAGESLELSWETEEIAPGTEFEVQVSYNRGAEFVTVGTTTESTFNWTVPADYSGNLTTRVVAKSVDGRSIESPTLVKGHRTVTKRK